MAGEQTDMKVRTELLPIVPSLPANMPVIIREPFWKNTHEDPVVLYVCAGLGEAAAPCATGDRRRGAHALRPRMKTNISKCKKTLKISASHDILSHVKNIEYIAKSEKSGDAKL